jgi:hypothetical protein
MACSGETAMVWQQCSRCSASCPASYRAGDGAEQITQLDQPRVGALLLGDDPINAGPKLLLAHPTGTRCLLDHAAKVAAIALGLKAKLISPQQLRQLGDVAGNPARLVIE